MAQATVNSGQDPSINDIKLDDLSLDDDALFADLDNEVRLEGTAEDSPSQGATDALNLDFDVEAVAKPKGKAPAKSGNGGGAPGSSGASGVDDLGLGLDDGLGGKGDIDLNMDDISGAMGDLNLNLEEPAGTPAAGSGAAGGDLLDLDISGASAGDLDLGLDQASAPASATMGETLDLDIPDAVQNGDELKLELEEPAAAAPEQAAETIELDLEGEATPSEKHSRAGIFSAEAAPGMDVEDLSHPRGAEQLEEVMLAEEAPMPAARGAAAAPEGPAGEFQALPDVDLDVVDLDLEQAASEFQAAPDVDLDAVDLNLDMPLAETHGDAGAPGEMAAAPALPQTGLSAGMGTGAGGGLAGAPDELLELNLADLESRPEAPGAGGRGNAAPSAWRASAARPPHVAVPAAPGAAVPAVERSPMSAMLLSLPHQVQVRMGTVSMLGQDLLNLGHGSVVPLNRTVGEPVDLIVDGKTIAQGELVVINGRNLGVRIVTLGG